VNQAKPPLDSVSVFAKSFFKASVVLLLPVTLLVLLRLFLHQVLGLRIGFTYVTDFDFLLPAPLAFYILMYVLERGEPLRLKLQTVPLAIVCIAVGVFLSLNINFEGVSHLAPWAFTSLWFLSLTTIVVASLCACVPPAYYYRNPNRYVFLPCTLIALSVAIHTRFITAPWSPFATMTSHTVGYFFSSAFGKAVQISFTAEDALKVIHPKLSVRIGQGCGGMEGFSFFSLLFLIYYSLRRNYSTKLQWTLFYLTGVIGMYFVNVARIISLFVSGILLRQHLGLEMGTDIFRALFHTHLGWVFFSLWSAAYFVFLRYLQGSELAMQIRERQRAWSKIGA